MCGIRRWLLCAALLAPAIGSAQTPAPLPGTVVTNPPVATLPGAPVGIGTYRKSTINPLDRPTYSATMTSIPSASPAPTAGPLPVGQIPGVMEAPVIQQPSETTQLMPKPGDCCGPVGGNGPIGQDVYFRAGVALPFGKGNLPKELNLGWTFQLGARSEFFDTDGRAAWAVDAHVYYAYNNAGGQGIVFLRNDIVTVRALHRWAAGLLGGRDWFLNGPGFVGGMWDLNTAYGLDFGGRWGTGHVDAQPITDATGYRRKQDVFGQLLIAAHADFSVPVGGWTFVGGARLELDYTASDFLNSGSCFYDLNFMLTVGVRY